MIQYTGRSTNINEILNHLSMRAKKRANNRLHRKMANQSRKINRA